MRSFKPQGKRCGAIYNKTRRGRKLVFPCMQQQKWVGERVPGFIIKPGVDNRIVVYLPKDEDLSPLDALLEDWE